MTKRYSLADGIRLGKRIDTHLFVNYLTSPSNLPLDTGDLTRREIPADEIIAGYFRGSRLTRRVSPDEFLGRTKYENKMKEGLERLKSSDVLRCEGEEYYLAPRIIAQVRKITKRRADDYKAVTSSRH